ncbi:MAG: hypothetical protein UT05_C0013G0007 [Parcubacteria group bacterium GW2011_GWF2_38_76]|nr:MAG: hypothetical protein UT05_C0013G0007 [Parcubacteria group bacterium GW2011_GWF2_38_76]HBM45401.1 hypothetical protein [Patescibacteria group bacterium]
MLTIPIWARDFNNEIIKLRKRAKKYDIYEGEQPYLIKLRKSGQGNCVAVSKLFRKILRKYKISYQHIIIGEYDKTKERHQITIVRSNERSIWLQSNTLLMEFQSFSKLIAYAEEEMGWKDKGMAIEQMKWVKF